MNNILNALENLRERGDPCTNGLKYFVLRMPVCQVTYSSENS